MIPTIVMIDLVLSRFECSGERGKVINLKYTVEDMKSLPLRAIVALRQGVRIRRVEHLALSRTIIRRA